MAKIGKFAQITARVLQRIIWPTKIYGAENFEKFNGGIIISNHYASAADGSIIFNAFFKNYFNALVKEEAFKTKIGNWFLTGVGCIPVKRGEADIDAYKKVVTVLKNGENILIFPEGTRNKAGTDVMAPFKRGFRFSQCVQKLKFCRRFISECTDRFGKISLSSASLSTF